MEQYEPSYRDALPDGPAHRRGAGLNPGNRFDDIRLHVLGEELDRRWVEREAEGDEGAPQRVQRQVFRDRTKTIINRVARTSDVPFDWTVNPYRGCEHGCIYCFARPYHEYLGFSCGLDFETKIMAKPEAPELLKRELAKRSWKGEPIVMSAITDVYQPIEHEMRITRQCLEVMAECNQPVSTMTKSAMVLRDVDLWQRLAAKNAGRVIVTLVTLDAELARTLEPRASAPAGRLRTIRELTDAGVPVSVNIAPIIPGLTDTEVPRILEAIADAGAKRAAWVLLRLPYQVKELFLEWLTRNVHPDRARKVESLIRQGRGGKLYDASKNRGRGEGPIVRQIKQNFDVFSRRYGLNRDVRPLSGAHFVKPDVSGQMGLFG
ncbi:MAG: PA0069 family radical SAM protein [Phycisphaera sp.]|nr:MAG: PA0069 family radical SAM protein [Phycisphaera sp.]